jgi:hypothetical protein
MSRQKLFLAVAAPLALSALAFFARPHTPARPPAPAPAASSDAEAASPAAPARSGQKARRARYRLSSVQRAVIEGRERASLRVEGTWTTTEREGERIEARFAASRIEAVGEAAPSAAEVAAPFEICTTDGVLRALAFPEDMSRQGRALLTGLATTFQHTGRSGPSWSVEEEDLAGTYVAAYERLSGGRVSRKRGAYTKLRGPGGLATEAGGGVHPVESTELRFDERGLVSATVGLVHTVPVLKGMAPIRLTTEATLVREEVEEVAWSAGLGLAAAPIVDHVDRAALARKRDEARVAGATAGELLSEARRVAHLDGKQPDATKARAKAQGRLASLVKLDARAAGEVADAIRRDPGDAVMVPLLTGALAGADAPAGADALASLLDDEALPQEARDRVLDGLTLARSPTPESAAALTRALDKPYGEHAALALGAQARGLGDEGAGADAVDQLLERYAAASTPAEKRAYLLALGNTGSPKVLDVLLAAVQGDDFEAARIATNGLRLIPGDDVDDALLSLIRGASPVLLDAIRAVAYRSPALWTPRLQAAKAQFEGQKQIVETIQAVLVRWSNLAKPGQP